MVTVTLTARLQLPISGAMSTFSPGRFKTGCPSPPSPVLTILGLSTVADAFGGQQAWGGDR